jgi:hypothetical protein
MVLMETGNIAERRKEASGTEEAAEETRDMWENSGKVSRLAPVSTGSILSR